MTSNNSFSDNEFSLDIFFNIVTLVQSGSMNTLFSFGVLAFFIAFICFIVFVAGIIMYFNFKE